MPGLTLARMGTLLLIAMVGGFFFDVSIPTKDGPFSLRFGDGDVPLFVVAGGFIVAVILIFVGVRMTLAQLQRRDRKRVIAVELRGLRDTSGTPLMAAIPASIEGRRDQLLIDLRQGADGAILSPELAIKRIEAMPARVATQESGLDREDVQMVLGGLAPVPLSFLLGVLVDDESQITLMDWDRHENNWRSLSASDDGMRFATTGLDQISAGQAEVVLAVSTSYSADRERILAAFVGLPIVQLDLENRNADSHWSEAKQIELGKQFLDVLMELGGKGVCQIHLVLAAQNSVVLRFGRLYDKRNLPDVIVYQYERDQSPAYPWGIKMPVENRQQAELIRRD